VDRQDWRKDLGMRRTVVRLVSASLFVALLLFTLPGVPLSPRSIAAAQSQAVEVTPGIPVTQEQCCGAIFATFNVTFDYEGGKVLWAGSQDGTATTEVDDIANISVSGSNGTHSTSFTYGTFNPCEGVFSKSPQDITSLFSPGSNSVTVTLQDNGCGINYSSSPLWIVPATQHFHIELKAWIPQPRVVNPINPIPIPVGTLRGIFPSCANPPLTLVYSEFHGDGHAGYDGDYRVFVTADFDWDGKEIKNFQSNVGNGNYGTTTLFETYTLIGTSQILAQCSLSKTATCCVAARVLKPNFFVMTINSGNPFFPGVAPPIKATINATIAEDGSIHFTGLVNQFPSKALKVVLNGNTLDTDTIVDASCLANDKVLGIGGAHRLTIGLVDDGLYHDFTAAPTDRNIQTTNNSFLCSLP
jgi:hypothetical protein